MKRVLFVINTLSRAGAEVALVELLKHFSEPEMRIDLLVLTAQGEMRKELPDHVHVLNDTYSMESVFTHEGRRKLKKLLILSALRRANGLRLLPYMIRNAMIMRKKAYRREENLFWRLVSDGAPRSEQTYDLAVAFLEGGATYYVADHVSAKHKAAFVHVDYTMGGYDPAMDRGCYDAFDRIYAVSEETRQGFLAVYPQYTDRTEVFPNMVNQESIRQKSCAVGGFADDFCGIRLLTVGRLTRQKGYEIALRAMELILQKRQDVRWYVIGDGPLKDELKKAKASSEAGEHFVLLGAKENPYPYMKQCDLYVHATRFEGKSIALQEALTLGCAVIVSDVEGNREQVEHGKTGWICGLSPEEIAEAVLILAKDPKLRCRLKETASGIVYSPEEGLANMRKLLES